jgi:hypothetical protein
MNTYIYVSNVMSILVKNFSNRANQSDDRREKKNLMLLFIRTVIE